MLQLNLLPAAPGLSKLPGQGGTPLGGVLSRLFGGQDDASAAFSAELHALLLSLDPALVQRLEEMVQGGTPLPQAARSLLAGPLQGPGENFARLLALAPGAGAGGAAGAELESVVAAAADAGDLPQTLLAAVPLQAQAGGAHGLNLELPFAAALPNAPPGSSVTGLSPPLTSNLLAMGVPQRVATPEWEGAIADRVFWMAKGGQEFARLQLNPPNLGPLEVRLEIRQDQASVAFIAGQAAVREALEAALPRLREMFDQQSMLLVRAEVRDSGAERGDQGAASDGGSGRRAGPAGMGMDPAESEQLAPQGGAAANRLIDLFA